MTFSEEVADLGLTKEELASRLGVFPSTVTVWGENPPPYAVAYLEVLREKRTLVAEMIAGLDRISSIVTKQAD